FRVVRGRGVVVPRNSCGGRVGHVRGGGGGAPVVAVPRQTHHDFRARNRRLGVCGNLIDPVEGRDRTRSARRVTVVVRHDLDRVGDLSDGGPVLGARTIPILRVARFCVYGDREFFVRGVELLRQRRHERG